MSYTYTAVIVWTDSDGRFANLTDTPTVTAYDLAGNSISSPSITNIATGVYKVSVSNADLEDVIFRVVPHVDDQDDFDDVAVMQDKVTHTADDMDGKIDTIDGIVDDILVDTGTTIPGTITTIDNEIATIDGNVDDILVDTGTTIPGTITTIDNEIATIDGIVDSILEDTGTTLPNAISAIDTDSVMDAVVEDSLTLTEILRIMVGVLAGKLSGGGTTTLTFRDLADSLDRVVATVDSSGNRSAITIDES